MHALPDLAGLQTLGARDWHALQRRLLAIGLDAAAVTPELERCARFPEDERDPIRLWHLRRRGDPAALAMRLLMFGDALTRFDANAALGASLCRRLASAGMLLAEGERFTCALRLTMAGRYYVFADELSRGGDVVMGMRETTMPLWRAVAPDAPVRTALDLGCGAGAIALLLSERATSVVATDINPRAVTLARINLALNGVNNVVVREGDLFAPVQGEAFDLIAAHPPYVARPDFLPAVSHLHGGTRGDELACRLLAELAPHLAPEGRAVLQVHWPLRPDEAPAARIRAACGEYLNLLVLQLGATGADELATFWGSRHADGAAAVARIRDHYAQLGVAATVSTLCVLSHGAASGWTRVLDLPPESVAQVTSARIDRLLQSCALLHGDDTALLQAPLRLPEGATLANLEDAGGGSRMLLLLPPAALRPATEATAETWRMLTAVHRAPNVRRSRQKLPLVRAALEQGLLEPE